MPGRRLLPSLAAAVAVLLTLGACSDGPGTPAPSLSGPPSPSAAGLPADVRADLAALWAGDAPSSRDVEAGACFADALAELTTDAELRDAGLVDGRGEVVAAVPVLDEATARSWVEAQQQCVDFVTESTRAQVAATKGALDEQSYAACLRAALDDEAITEALVATLTGRFEGPEVEALGSAQAGCAAAAVPADE